jgi:two-component system, cell cycle sensor histidine kinase PleC
MEPLDDAAELRALRQENAILRETLDAIDGTVVVYDAQRRYILGNRAYHEHFPHLPNEQELAGKPYEEVLSYSIAAGTVVDQQAYTDPASFIRRRIRDIEGGEAVPREVYDHHTGKWYMIRVRLTPGGNRVSLRVDIDAQKRLQQELDQARNAAEVASRTKSTFLANIGHELRTPLNAVINFARLLEDQIHGPLGAADYIDYAQSIRESGAHLLSLIDELLDLARAEAGRLTLAEQRVDLRAVVHSVCRLLQPDANAARVQLLTDLPDDLPAVRADATRVRQIMFNLVTNAIKFSVPGGTVRISAAVAADGRLLIGIADTGQGISADDLPRVMLPFERGAAPGREVVGVGLGLPLVRHLVALHGGELLLESTPGQGTTASFSLPGERVLAVKAAET